MFDVVERIGLRKFVFPDFAPTGQPYDSPGQRPGLSREVGLIRCDAFQLRTVAQVEMVAVSTKDL